MYIKGNLEGKKLSLRLICTLGIVRPSLLVAGCDCVIIFYAYFFLSNAKFYFYPGFSLFAIHWPGGVPG